MPMYDFVCPREHAFDSIEKIATAAIPCAVCMGQMPNGRYSSHSWEIVKEVSKTMLAMVHEENPTVFMAWRTQLSTPSWKVRTANPLKMTVHRDPETGDYRFPAHRDAPMPAGFERIDVDSAQQARKIEKHVRETEEAKGRDKIYRDHQYYDGMRRAGEADINAVKGDFSQFGRAFADQAMDRNRKMEADRSTAFSTDVGFDALANDKSNREPHADEETGWRTSTKV